MQQGLEIPSASGASSRCAWAGDDPVYVAYHDGEWGRPVTADNRLFEKLCLEGFQSGLSWLTILRKRERFREVFHGFEIARVAAMGADDVARLLGDPGIVRHRGKIVSTINNAARAREVAAEFGSLSAYLWGFEPPRAKAARAVQDIPAHTPASHAMSRDLRRRGFTFVGPTTCYALMQAMGLVNDHVESCFCRAGCEAERERLERPLPR